MTKKYASIPNPTGGNDRMVLDAVTDVLAYITGQQQPRIQQLPATASLTDCINKINEVIARLQGQ